MGTQTEGEYMAKVYESRRRATEKWKKEHTKQIKFNFNIDTEADIIQKLESVDNKIGYVRDLIRADIAKEGK